MSIKQPVGACEISRGHEAFELAGAHDLLSCGPVDLAGGYGEAGGKCSVGAVTRAWGSCKWIDGFRIGPRGAPLLY